MNNAMVSRLRRVAAGLAALAITVSAASPAFAIEPEKVSTSKIKYNATELVRSVSDDATIVSTETPERVTFTVHVDKDGSVSSVTYKHNVTSKPAARVQTFIDRAYAAIMSAEFTPAKANGQPIKDSVTIAFELEN
jgi:predicted secreted protein